jgi:hypothetical protein
LSSGSNLHMLSGPPREAFAALVTLCMAPFFHSQAVHAQTRPGGGSRSAPVQVQPFRGKYCASIGPVGWAVTAENAQRVAFGADLSNAQGTAGAGYSIYAGGSLGIRGTETPDRAVAYQLSNFGRTPTRFGNRRQMGPNTFLMEYQTAAGHGVAFWQVIPAGQGSFMIVMRTAVTGPQPGAFQRYGPEAMAVARALRCQVPNVPPAPDPPGLNRPRGAARTGGKEDDSLYNQWLDKETYHDQYGRNYWVSPSQDWTTGGPRGDGYYVHHGNDNELLQPGPSQ